MSESAKAEAKRLLLEAFRAGLDATRGDRLVARALEARTTRAPLILVAAGKAATAMAKGAADALGDRIRQGLVVDASVQHHDWPFPCRVLAGDHPVPGEASLEAGRALLALLDDVPSDCSLLFLVSGGTSSLVEVPAPGVGPADLARANEWLLASGMDIARINSVRHRLSRIKGGRLLRFLGDREATVLALSDVPDNDPRVIGSGWLEPPGDGSLPDGLPAWLEKLARRSDSPPPADDPARRRISTRILADNRVAVDAAAASLRGNDMEVRVIEERLAGEAAEEGRAIARMLAGGGPGAVVMGGECTVTLPDHPGRGGRCQHLALAAARELAGREDCWLLAAGTDGRDGDSEVAGALVDGGTTSRGEVEALSARRSLARADSGTFLEAAGDLLDTGPTGTNVNDLVIGIRR